jgi:DNA-binding NtrC family response regulator
VIDESVDVHRVRGTLQALAESGRWKTPETAWQAFRAWGSKRGLDLPLSPESPPLRYHELQHLYAFGVESAPDGFMRRVGRRIGRTLWRERLADFLSPALAPKVRVAEACEELFRRFMEAYSILAYRFESKSGARRLDLRMSYRDGEQMRRYLGGVGLDPDTCFRRSFEAIAGTVEACLEQFIEPWSAKDIDVKPEAGTLGVEFAADARFNLRGILETLGEHARELRDRAERTLHSRDLERDLLLRSPLVRETWRQVRVAAETDETVLLRGEPGTGKTHLAARIHGMSARRAGPFVEVALTSDVGSENLVQSHLFGHVKGAFTGADEARAGVFAEADGGTIFLDEVGDATPDLQAKLLRVLEKRAFRPVGGSRDVTVNVRILAATNADLEARVGSGRFRADLFHRLNVISIELPPLRRRLGDVPALCDHFLRTLAVDVNRPAKPLAADARAALEGYDWPGNLRELIHALKHGLLFSEGREIRRRDLPEPVRDSKAPPKRKGVAPPASRGRVVDVEELERLLGDAHSLPAPGTSTWEIPWHIDQAKRTYLETLIRHCRGNVRKMTAYWDRSSEFTLRGILKRYGLWDAVLRARNGDK